MDHQAFANRTAAALQLQSDGQPRDAAVALRDLLRDLESPVKEGVNEWHQQQTLALLIDALAAASDIENCRAAWEELIEFTTDAATYWEHARKSAQADFDRWTIEHPPG